MKRNPYEWLYETQARPLKSWVLDEVTKLFAEAVEKFPPVIEDWEREDLRERFEPVLQRVHAPLAEPVLRLALQLFRWEIEREYERMDRYLRGGHQSEFGLDNLQLDTAMFVWHYWVDQMLAFMEVATGKFRRHELLGIADRLESRLLPGPVQLIERLPKVQA